MTFLSVATRRECPPDGNIKSRIAIIGEAPSVKEMQLLKPFIGPAGSVNEQCMHSAGIIRKDCYITNLFKIKVRKVGGDIYDDKTKLWSYNGFTEEGQKWVDRLRAELQSSGANIFVGLGGPAYEALSGKKGISKWRGSVTECQLLKGRKCIGTIHPAATFRGPDAYIDRYKIVSDYKKAKKESLDPRYRPPQREYIINPDYGQCLAVLEQIKIDCLSRNLPLSVDIEVFGGQIFSLGLTNDPRWGISIPFTAGRWKEDEEYNLWNRIAGVLQDARITKVGQNLPFDVQFLALKHRIYVRGDLDDTMVAQHLCYPDFPKGLDFICSIHSDEPYYKDDGKEWFKLGGSPDQLFEYNIKDVCVTLEAWQKLEQELQKHKHQDTYNWTMRLYPALLYIMTRGILADEVKLQEARAKAKDEQALLQGELDAIVEHKTQGDMKDLNVASPKQCQLYFYGFMGVKPYINRKTGGKTTDDKAMARIARGTKARPGLREASLVQEIRSYRKLIGTYLDITLDSDKRVRCSYNPRGTTTGRLSSSKTIFGTGTNMQNLPPQFKKFLVADDGYMMVEIDKAQAEWVVTAFYSGDAGMMQVVNENLDPHTHTAHLMTGVPKELIVVENKLGGHITDPGKLYELREKSIPGILLYPFLPRTMTCRQAGKKSNHALNYGMGANEFALQNEVEMDEAKRIVQAYHKAYPGIRSGFWSRIQSQLQKDRTITNCFGRRRMFLAKWDERLFKSAYDFIPQSTVADLINRGMIYVYEDESYYMRYLELLAQTHDSITFQYPLSLEGNSPNAYEDMTRKMAMAIKQTCDYLNPTLEYHARKFQIANEVKVGFSWGEMEEVDAETTVTGLADQLLEVCRKYRASTSIPSVDSD